MVGSISFHVPENAAMVGADQRSPSRCDTRIVLADGLLRWKNT
ncbi:MAG TPA: hypothetical protein VFL45_05075 [Gammaproteobacteria bacterium]|nr:hypothetical protein [Gammaproteobacteria bacterium]